MERQTRAIYPLEHECLCCGCSCMAQLVGPLSDHEHQNILSAHKHLSESGCVDGTVNPVMKGLKPDGSCLYFLNFPQKRCFFLGDDNLCHIHGKIRADQKPLACRRFPRIAIKTEEEIRVGIKPYCYGLYGHWDDKPVDDGYLNRFRADEANWQILKDLTDNAAYRPVIRSQDGAELEAACNQERDILSKFSTSMSYAALMTYLISGKETECKEFSTSFLNCVHDILIGIKPQFKAEIDKLGQTVHAKHAQELYKILDKPLKNSESLCANHEFSRYARYAIHQLVFLRETTRFPAVSVGAFAFGIGALVASQDAEHAGDHLTCWLRLMAQTQLFMMLFPSPDILMELASSCM